MTTPMTEVIERFVKWREGSDQEPLRGTSHKPFVDPNDERQLVTETWTGASFVIVRDMGEYWLLNGDEEPGTQAVQMHARNQLRWHTQRERLIVPFSALGASGVDHETIKPIEITQDGAVVVTESTDDIKNAPLFVRDVALNLDKGATTPSKGIWRDDNGRYFWKRNVHRLGASLFWAENAEGGALYLSAFDQQERFPLYFLARMPDTSNARTVDQAFDDLKPSGVVLAEADYRQVERQGDVFAYDDGSGVDTRALKKAGFVIERRWDGYGKVAGTDHAATHVARHPDGTEYARGSLYHDVRGRMPDHTRRRLNDRDKWLRIARNTVPWSAGAPQAFTRRGRVD